MAGKVGSNLVVTGCADFPPVRAIQRGLPGDLKCTITIAVWIVCRAADGDDFADCGGALDEEVGVAVVDVWNGQVIGVDRFAESLTIGIGDDGSDPLPLKVFGDVECGCGADDGPVDAIAGLLP